MSPRPRLATTLARAGSRRLAEPRRRATREFVRRVRDAPDGSLERVDGIVARALVSGIFRAAATQLNRRAARDFEAAIEWRVTEADGGASLHTMLIAGGRCRVKRGPVADPDLTIELEFADFLRLVAGTANGVALFGEGRLRLRGDLGVALRLPRLFRIPGPAAPASPGSRRCAGSAAARIARARRSQRGR